MPTRWRPPWSTTPCAARRTGPRSPRRSSAADRDWDLVKALLESYTLRVEPVTADDGELAARRWRRGAGRSLADRLCLALGERLDADVLTADSERGTVGRIRQIR